MRRPHWLMAPETGGERRVALALATLAAVGAAVALRVAVQLNGFEPLRPGYGLWVATAGGIGAASGLWVVRRHYGHSGARGALRFGWGLVMGSVVAALLAGTLVLPLYGTMFGPFALLTALAGAPALALLWLLAFARFHRSMIDWRRERDSLFAWRPRA
ncbi:hypothetical protein [Pseudoroseicyclus tamaricis]|uniref:Uncharacterized protein n=1 Tax=Pseudoroseicyclus tamaricis TaxID=2705421 RepID=A0A6B2JJG9_9RHOB|nr:hypothetical protein [Pseudoroseicyclus tamaricis]NDV01583.1 hypothetical protein [Pseudoroseicyclus tamaricis]